MNSHYFILLFLIFEKSFGFKPNHQIDRQTKSIFSNKKGTESFTPARYKIGNKKYEQPTTNNIMPEQFFPEMEYPTNIMEASRPFFYKTGESNALLGPFPDDVKSSYKSLIRKNKKSFEELKAKYINDNSLNAKNYLQENTVPISKQETIVEETGSALNDNAVEVAEDIAEEVSEEIAEEIAEEVAEGVAEGVAENKAEKFEEVIIEISQNEPLTGEEVDLMDTTSESDETIEIKDKVVEVFKPQAAQSENIGEEEIVAEDQFQSWESVQYFSEEAIAEEISEGDLGPVLEALLVSEENIEDINSSVLLEESEDEVVIEVPEPENPEEEICLLSPPENKENATICDSKKELNMKLMQKIRKDNFFNRRQKKKPFSLRKDHYKKL